MHRAHLKNIPSNYEIPSPITSSRASSMCLKFSIEHYRIHTFGGNDAAILAATRNRELDAATLHVVRVNEVTEEVRILLIFQTKRT